MSTTLLTATHHFEFFQGTSTESRTRPQITVRKGGLRVLTEAAARMQGQADDPCGIHSAAHESLSDSQRALLPEIWVHDFGDQPLQGHALES